MLCRSLAAKKRVRQERLEGDGVKERIDHPANIPDVESETELLVLNKLRDWATCLSAALAVEGFPRIRPA